MRQQVLVYVLPRRWGKLWTLIPSQNFDREQKLYDLGEMTNYVKWVNRVPELYQGPAIDQFRVCINLDESYSRDILIIGLNLPSIGKRVQSVLNEIRKWKSSIFPEHYYLNLNIIKVHISRNGILFCFFFYMITS